MEEMLELNGKVIDSNQQPLEDVVVSILSAPGQMHDIAAITNADGIFSFSDLAGGQYRLKLFYDECETEETFQLKSTENFFTFRFI